MKKLIKWELLVENNIHNLIKYLIIFFLFSTISIVLISSQEDIKKFGLIFSVICLIISLIGFSSILFKSDFEDGTLELLLSTFSSDKIVLSKFLAVLCNSIIATCFIIPIICVLFNLSLLAFVYFTMSLFLLLILSSALVVLSGSVQSYFRFNTNFLAIFIMPLLIPDIIMMGLILQDYNMSLIFMMIGINTILLPILFFFSSFLIKNVYNV